MNINEASRVLFLTKHSKKGASSRYRSFQYLDFLQQAGLRCDVSPLFDDAYLEYKYSKGRSAIITLLRAAIRRFFVLVRIRRYDIVVIEKELFPYCFALPERLLRLFGRRYVVDFDDALFHQYDSHRSWVIRFLLGKKISTVMRLSHVVIAGNQYLADYAKKSGARCVEILPTVVDLERYQCGEPLSVKDDVLRIVWIGSPSTAKYCSDVMPALTEVCAQTGAKLVLIGAGDYRPASNIDVEILEWSSATEVEQLRNCDIGIMPLTDHLWERGKCGFKLIQYMACGLPVVASPVGVNPQIVVAGENGYLASDAEEWTAALKSLIDNPLGRKSMGMAGRKLVEKEYALTVTAPKMARILKTAARS